MKFLPLIWDVLEVTAVFLLAAEAIKVRNLQWIRVRAITLHRVVNPEIQVVDELPKNMRFVERYFFELFFLGFFVFGTTAIVSACRALDIPLSILVPNSLMGWIVIVVAILVGPLLIGLSLYTAVVWLLQRVVAGLAWIEANTRNGAVGILGFIVFLIQFIGRRVFAL